MRGAPWEYIEKCGEALTEHKTVETAAADSIWPESSPLLPTAVRLRANIQIVIERDG